MQRAPFAASSSYNTPLDPGMESFFRQWLVKNKVPFDPEAQQSDYDMRGFYKALQQKNPQAQSAMNANDGRMHYPDYWKTPLHHSFSSESQWAGPSAPSWINDHQLVSPGGRVVFDEKAPQGLFDLIRSAR